MWKLSENWNAVFLPGPKWNDVNHRIEQRHEGRFFTDLTPATRRVFWLLFFGFCFFLVFGIWQPFWASISPVATRGRWSDTKSTERIKAAHPNNIITPITYRIITRQDEAPHTRDEAREERVEGKGPHEEAITELQRPGEQYIQEVRVQQLQTLRSGAQVFF